MMSTRLVQLARTVLMNCLNKSQTSDISLVFFIVHYCFVQNNEIVIKSFLLLKNSIKYSIMI